MKIRLAAFTAAMLAGGLALAQEVDLQVKLMGPVGTKISKKGDRVFGQVVQPGAFQGDTIEGAVKDVKSGGKLRGGSVLSFSFETLQHGGQPIAVSTQVRSFQNSRGQADVDEEGRVIRKGGGNTGKAAAGTAAGSLIGGLAGGWKGAAIGAGVGAAASIAMIEIAADSPEIRFDAGSIVTVSATTHSGPALTEIAGAAPASKPAVTSEAGPVPAAPARTAVAAAPPAAAAASAGDSGQPNLVTLKADFVPGEKTLLYDDFTDMSPDDAPPHWKVRGGSVALKQGDSFRQATITSEHVKMTAMLKGLPKNFTIETEMKFDNAGDLRSSWGLHAKGSEEPDLHIWNQTREGALRVQVSTKGEQLTDTEVPCDFSKPIKHAIWIQNGRVRVYVNGQRALDANQVELPAIETAVLATDNYGEGSSTGYRSIRIAESTPDFGKTIMGAGRYVTYGILFDTDSDRLKPESAGVLKSIASGLQANPSLKVQIEGHTDNVGQAAHNLDLSKRRAEAVKGVLVSQFQIDATRLTTAGLGDTKPAAPNDTPQGRSQNRRVELVRQ